MARLTRIVPLLVMLVAAACGGGAAEDQVVTSPTADEESQTPQASVTVEEPADGATVTSPVTVRMAASGVAIEPAAEGVKPNSGHFHIIVDGECLAAGEVIPADATHLHFGQAQTEVEVPLSSGPHRLCVQVADAAHVATDLTQVVAITVS